MRYRVDWQGSQVWGQTSEASEVRLTEYNTSKKERNRKPMKTPITVIQMRRIMTTLALLAEAMIGALVSEFSKSELARLMRTKAITPPKMNMVIMMMRVAVSVNNCIDAA